MIKKVLLGILLLIALFLAGCAGYSSNYRYAPYSEYYHYPYGDMLRIASVVSQVGYGHYPTDWIYLKPQYQKHLKGYIQWNTFSSRTPYLGEWTQITLKVSIIDKAGNLSDEVVFPFTFESGVKNQYEYKLPVLFDERDFSRLGYIHIDLFEPSTMGSGRR